MKRDWWIVFLAFLGGIVLTNLMGKEILVTYGIMNEYFLCQYSYQRIDNSRLFVHIMTERCQAAFIVFLLGKTMDGNVFALLTKVIVAAGFGFFIVVGIVNLGLRGLAVVFGGLFPQWFCYLLALFVYTNWRKEESKCGCSIQAGEITGRVAAGVLLVLCLLFGIVLESWVNPVILSLVLKIF